MDYPKINRIIPSGRELQRSLVQGATHSYGQTRLLRAPPSWDSQPSEKGGSLHGSPGQPVLLLDWPSSGSPTKKYSASSS